MGRIRTIKPEFWTDEELSELPAETHMLAAALLNYADDEGYFNANPKLVKAACCPLREDSVSTHEGLQQLANIGYIKLGTAPDGKRYGLIVGFTRHQKVNRPTPSKINKLCIVWDGEDTPHGSLTEDSLPERNREQGREVNTPDGVFVAGAADDGQTPCTGDGVNPKNSNPPPACPHQDIVDLYHEILPELPRVKVWDEQRQGFLRSRWREDAKRQNLDWWRRFFTAVRTSPWLMGQVPGREGRVFVCTLEWLIRPTNFRKVIEGHYADRRAA